MKINYIKTLVFSAFASVVLSGCSNFLDTKIDANMTPEMVDTNRGSLWNFGAAMYAPMLTESSFTILDGNFFAAASDEAQRTQASGNAYTFNRGTISPDNVEDATNYIYRYCYEGIRAANFFLDFAKDGEQLLALNRDTANDAINYAKDVRNLNWYRAEAHICRAYYYMELIKRFGGVPIVETTLDQDPNPGKIPCSSYDDVVEYIVNEIDSNLDSLQTSWRTSPDAVSGQDGRFEKKSALAIKARVLLYAASPLNNPTNDKSKWERAASAANDEINFMNYTMGSRTNTYSNYFLGVTSTTNAETIFVLRTGAGNYLQKNNYPIATPGGNSGVTPTENLVSAYEYIGAQNPLNPYANRDPRFAATIVYNGSTWNGRVIDESPGGTDDMRNPNASKTGYYVKKFLRDNMNLTQGTTDANVWVIFRYSEILLMYAEAMNEAYGPDATVAGYKYTARQALTLVRNSISTSLPAATTTDVDEFRKAVKHECQVEFAFEDHRYWDLLRWKDADTVLNTPVKGVIVTKDDSGNFVYQENDNAGERVFQTKNYRLPFARSEVVNSGGTIAQNEGY